MACNQIHEWLDPYLDGELDAELARRLEEHVAACPACAARARGERRVRELIAATAADEVAPAGLRERVHAHVRDVVPGVVSLSAADEIGDLEFSVEDPSGHGPGGDQREVSRPWRGRLGYALAFAASFAAFLFLWALFPRGDVEQAWAAGLASDHTDHHGPASDAYLYREDDVRVLGRWFKSRLGIEVLLPDDVTGAQLVGGQVCLVNGRRVAHAVYEVAGVKLSYFMVPDVAGPDSIVAGAVQGVNYLAWDSPAGGVFVVGALPVEQLETLQLRSPVA